MSTTKLHNHWDWSRKTTTTCDVATDPWDVFGKSVKAAIARSGFSQGQVAAELGVRQQSVSAWVRGKVIPGPNTLDRLADFVGGDAQLWHDLKMLSLREPPRHLITSGDADPPTPKTIHAESVITGSGHKSSEQSDLDALANRSGLDPNDFDDEEKAMLAGLFQGIRARREGRG